MKRREHLQKVILRRLLFYGRTTRPELVALTGCRAATVFEAIDALKASGMVIEPERRGKKTGRRAPELECSREFASFIGAELQNDGLIVVVTDCGGEILESYEKRFPSPLRDRENIREEIAHGVSVLRRCLGEKWESIRGVGLAVVDPAAAGEWLSNVPDVPSGIWSGRTIRTRMEYISRRSDAPGSLFRLDAGDGFDAGFISDGRLFTGYTGLEMNIGHLVIDRDGPECSCGGRGCLDAVAGKKAVWAMVRQTLLDGIAAGATEEHFTIRRFVDFVHSDKAARLIAEKVSENIGCALAAVVALLNPATIVIGGELAGMGDLLLDTVHRVLAERCRAGAVRKLKLELSALEPEDTARGAAIMIRDKVFGIEDQPN